MQHFVIDTVLKLSAKYYIINHITLVVLLKYVITEQSYNSSYSGNFMSITSLLLFQFIMKYNIYYQSQHRIFVN